MPADIAKTKRKRDITISTHLKKWLDAYKDKSIIAINFYRKNTEARGQLKLKRNATPFIARNLLWGWGAWVHR
jgi:hypothetical protein|tara:strand:- start:10133 stop:10351 length:219 start_codon:yes stop_codon:yes gene_type:complete